MPLLVPRFVMRTADLTQELCDHHTPAPLCDKLVRRAVTAKWGLISVATATAIIVFVSLLNGFLVPVVVRPKAPAAGHRRSRRPIVASWMKVVMAAWIGAIAYFAVVQTDMRLDYFIKRLGRIAMSLLPPLYFLTMRPSPLPRTLYLQVLPFHRWVSVVVIVLSTLHAIAYSYFYHRNGVLMDKILQPSNLMGVVALASYLLVGLTSYFRYKNYDFFYLVHIINAWGTLYLLQRHSRPRSNGYLAACLAILVYQVIFRIVYTANSRIRVQYVTNTLMLVTIPKAHLPRRFWVWSPGSHVRLSGPIYNPINWFKSSHPYTIASLPDESDLKLVVRKGNFPLKLRRTYSIYGPHTAIPKYLMQQLADGKIKRVLFVAGGSGIAFSAPVFRYFRVHGVDLRMVWAIRNPYDVKVLKLLQLQDEVLRGSIEIFYTGAQAIDEAEDAFELDISDGCGALQNEPLPPAGDGSKEPQKFRDPLVRQCAAHMSHARPHLDLRLKSWLYGLAADDEDCCCADRLIEVNEQNREGAWVIATGNPALVQDAEVWARRAGVCFFQEEFSM